MRRILLWPLLYLALAALLPTLSPVAQAGTAASAGHASPEAAAPHSFSGKFTGKVIYFSPAGFEPDFDLINRAIFETTVTSKSLPPMTLILDAYLENFQVDTTPVLPDLIHPKKLVSSSLGGFFSGKAIIVGPKNRALFVGTMLAEAFIRPQGIQHMILVQLTGQGSAAGGSGRLYSVFSAYKNFGVNGTLYGTLNIPRAAVAALHHGSSRLTAKQVLTDFQVQKPAQRGTTANGTRSKGYCFQGHCTNQKPGTHHTGSRTHTASAGGRPAWMTILGIALIVLAFVLLGIFFLGPRLTGRAGAAASGPG